MSVDQFFLSADTTDLNYPDVRPTLDLNFARTKTLDPRITFTRASGGSYVGADGLIKYAGVNEARFDHDPDTGESLGLLIEESRQNLVGSSEELDTGWGLSNIKTFGSGSVTNATEAPDGRFTADLITETLDTSNTQHTVTQSINVTSGSVYTVSIFAKLPIGSTRQLLILVANTNFTITPSAIFDLSNGSVTSSNNGNASVVPYANGWYRLILTTIPATSSGLNGFIFRLYDGSSNSTVYLGDGTSGIYLWGAQVEAGSFPTSYIPTQGSTRTRAADNAVITGKNFSDFYRQDEGTVFAEANGSGPLITPRATASAVDRIQLAIGISAVVASGSVEAGFGNTTAAKRVLSYKANNTNAAFDGVTGVNDTSCAIPSVDYATIGYFDFGGASRINGAIKRITFWPQRLPDSTLKAITR